MIEIEKKFILTPDQEKALIEGAEFLGEKQFTDIYYDNADFSLTKKDIWLRERSGRFELKLPMNDPLEKRVSDQYQELENENDILTHFEAKGISIKDFLIKKDYKPFCKVTTTRKKYKKNGFGIDLDSMDYGYTLAEIEYMTNDDSKIKEATNHIIDFAKKHNIDTTASILGKVMKYLQLNNPVHFQALINEGKIIKAT